MTILVRAVSFLCLLASTLFIFWVCMSNVSKSASKPTPIPPSSVSPREARLSVINVELTNLQKELESLDTSSKLNKENQAQWCSNFKKLFAIAEKQLVLITELEELGAGSMSYTVWKTTIRAMVSAKSKIESECGK